MQKILQEKSIEKHNKVELILPLVASSRELAMNGQLTQTVDDKLVNAIKEAFGFSGSAILLSKYAAGRPVSKSTSEHEEEDKV